MSQHPPRSNPTRLLFVAVLAALAVFSAGPMSSPTPADAGTAGTMEANLLSWINAERNKKGIPSLRLPAKLVDLAGDRAKKMASTGELDHLNCLACKLRKRGVSFDTCAEVIAYTTYPWGDRAARSIFNGWKGSSTHWGILMSGSYDRIGIGVAHRSSNKSTWAAAVLTG